MTNPRPDAPAPASPATDPVTTSARPTSRVTSPLLVGLMVVAIALCGLGTLAAILTEDTDGSPTATTTRSASASASARATATATATARAASTPPSTAPVAQPKPLPTDQVFSGRGAKVVKLSLAEDYLHIAKISHTGRSNFSIWSIDATGERLDLLVNEIGNYAGVRPLDLSEAPAALQIEADGSWRIEIQVAQKAPHWTGAASGKGSAVLLIPGGTQGITVVKATHSGRSNFVIWVYGEDSDLLVNEIGKYTGEVLVPPGMVLIEIEADGAWTIESS